MVVKMEEKFYKDCPFNRDQCDSNCALYVDPEELNETVRNKLASIGIVDRKTGMCSIKNMALCMSRYIFEKNSSNHLR